VYRHTVSNGKRIRREIVMVARLCGRALEQQVQRSFACEDWVNDQDERSLQGCSEFWEYIVVDADKMTICDTRIVRT
jgi:hypothetical protein